MYFDVILGSAILENICLSSVSDVQYIFEVGQF